MKRTRGIIIECGVTIEEEATTTISLLLGIDAKTSKALGDTSQALSFNHKISLIKDVKSITVEQSAKLQKFMEIRNKFAHVKRIESFQDLFGWNEGTKGIEKKLRKWYPEIQELLNDQEEYFLSLFLELFKDNKKFLEQLGYNHLIEKGIEQGKATFQIELLESIKESLKGDNNFNRVLEEATAQILARWEKELSKK